MLTAFQAGCFFPGVVVGGEQRQNKCARIVQQLRKRCEIVTSLGPGLSGLSEEGDVPVPDPNCQKCTGSGYCDCSVCKGTGKDKKGGSILERWTCNTCKGFGYVGCECISNAGLTPEQRGTR
ncbi:hypothetical protein NDN08_002796 [Rhodosorus marinus]|uniref:CR-type domain-containing protein n=1 Tax=Rhodosorus marinus TaxID=101924 RepID=A0AAV8UUS5_9RHOD|nr:hypothetical protein NDN08_002796 [Rhodosorus marinus]